MNYDPVTNPVHYNSHPSGIEVIRITEHMNFCLGNSVKYILRADHKHNAVEDLKKAVWYLEREIARREKPVKNTYKVVFHPAIISTIVPDKNVNINLQPKAEEPCTCEAGSCYRHR